MMNSTRITQCPHCRTRFHVDAQQLAAAQGAVRCGACRQVFDAQHCLEPIRDTQPEQRVNTQPPPERRHPLRTGGLIDDDLEIDLDSPDFEEELRRLTQQEEFTDLVSAPSYQPPAATTPVATPASAPESVSAAAADVPAKPITAEAEEPTTTADKAETKVEAETNLDDETGEAATDEPYIGGETEDNEAYTLGISATPDTADDADLLSGFDPISADPLYLDWQPKRTSVLSLWLWGGCCLLAITGLAAQYTYYNFDQLARQSETRPWLEQLCTWLDCELPSKVDVNLIKSSNLIVRAHPQYRNALTVDAILYNRASFAQPFPLLQLNFTDKEHTPLAQRTFAPQEYLGGELAGQQSMPSQTPIHIALEVLIPHPQASNYSIQFLSPD